MVGHGHRRARGPGKRIRGASPVQYIARGTQPQSAAGEAAFDIRDHDAIRSSHEPDQPFHRKHRAGVLLMHTPWWMPVKGMRLGGVPNL